MTGIFGQFCGLFFGISAAALFRKSIHADGLSVSILHFLMDALYDTAPSSCFSAKENPKCLRGLTTILAWVRAFYTSKLGHAY